MFIRWGALLSVAILALGSVSPVLAQEPTETPTPTQTETPLPTITPSYQQAVPMSTGNSLLLVKQVTYGDIATVVAVLVLAAVQIVRGMVEIPKRYFTK